MFSDGRRGVEACGGIGAGGVCAAHPRSSAGCRRAVRRARAARREALGGGDARPAARDRARPARESARAARRAPRAARAPRHHPVDAQRGARVVPQSAREAAPGPLSRRRLAQREGPLVSLQILAYCFFRGFSILYIHVYIHKYEYVITQL